MHHLLCQVGISMVGELNVVKDIPQLVPMINISWSLAFPNDSQLDSVQKCKLDFRRNEG